MELHLAAPGRSFISILVTLTDRTSPKICIMDPNPTLRWLGAADSNLREYEIHDALQAFHAFLMSQTPRQNTPRFQGLLSALPQPTAGFVQSLLDH